MFYLRGLILRQNCWSPLLFGCNFKKLILLQEQSVDCLRFEDCSINDIDSWVVGESTKTITASISTKLEMAQMEMNISYGVGQRDVATTASNTYEIIPPQPNNYSTVNPGSVKEKRGHCFNIFHRYHNPTAHPGLSHFFLLFTTLQIKLLRNNKPLKLTLCGPWWTNQVKSFTLKLKNGQDLIESLQQQVDQRNQEIIAKLQRLLQQNNVQEKVPSNSDQSYCDTNPRNCTFNSTGGWTRVANLNVTDPTQQCPDGFKLINRTEPPLRTCGRPDGTVGCVSTTFPVLGTEYSTVCGRIIGYQVGSTNGFINDNIDSTYIAGISLTHGHPRQHIWSFVNALSEGYELSACPCTRNDGSFTDTIPSFIGEDYFLWHSC